MKIILSFYADLLLKLSLTQSILITTFTSWIQCLWGGVPCQRIPPSVSRSSALLVAACWEKLLPLLPRCSVSNPPLSLVSFRTPCSWDILRGRSTRSDSKVMRLVPKKSFILFIHQWKYCHLQSTSLVPAHTFSSSAASVCSIPGTQLEECCLRPALQTCGCLLLTQNGVLSLPILFFWNKKMSQGARSGE